MSVDLNTYASVESYPSQEDLNAWRRISFWKASQRHHQHLDVGCGLGFFFAIFGCEELVPDEEKEAFKNVWRTILEKKTQERPEGGRQLKFLISVTHAAHRSPRKNAA
ncbi:hypothetical protein HPB50_029211 [Hyalomma asiaticum]|nr:hypothetical protein HPB50_029211 [Hyalomma asiaticum]